MPTTCKAATSKKQKKKSKMKVQRTKIVDLTVEALRSMRKAVSSELNDCKPGDELETLVRTLQHNVQAQQIKEDILAAFQHYYPGIFKDDQLHLFGSTVTGLAFKDSDLDVYVDLAKCESSKSKEHQIKMIRNILESTEKFAKFKSITTARVPIIKCTHIETLTNCDFNCTNQFGSLNSPIIAHLLDVDPRIRKLAFCIKYWMKIHDCAGVNRISSYAVVWMLIFYLQTLPKPIVPPIDDFQQNVPALMVSHYNFAFDYAMPNRTENKSQWPDLLLGFFRFYRDFDYESRLICPLYGKTLSKTDVNKGEILELQRYRQVLSTDLNEKPMLLSGNSLCIQDPFDIVRKVPGSISAKNFQQIVWKIGYAAEIIHCELRKLGETKSLFRRLFDITKFNEYVCRRENEQKLERKSKDRQRIAEKRQARLDRFSHKHKDQITTGQVEQKTIEEGRRKVEVEQINYLPISSVSVLSKNVENGKIRLQLRPSHFIMIHICQNGARNIVRDRCGQSDNYSIRKLWAKDVIEMIVDILSDIFYLDLYDKASSDEWVKKFDLIGARNVFEGREQKKCFAVDTWIEEVIDSSNRFNGTSKVIPLELSAKVTADAEDFKYVFIEFNDEIKTKDENFYTTFCAQFVGSIDYFLKIYFAHRNETSKSGTVSTNMAKVKLALESATKGQVTLTLPQTPMVSRSSRGRTVTLRVKRNAFMMSAARKISKNRNATSDKLSVPQSWAQEVIKVIPDILIGIFKVEVANDVSRNPFRRIFDLTGLFDHSNRLFLRRHQKKCIAETWNEELLDSSNRFDSKSIPCDDVPLNVSAKIVADDKHFDYALIEFKDQIDTKRLNFFRTFCQDFISRIDYFLKIYFVHLMAMPKSVTVTGNPLKSATLPIIPTDPQKSESPKTTLVQVKRTEFMLSAIRNILWQKDVAQSEKHKIQEFWAQEVIEMITDVLTGIFAFELHNIKSDKFMKVFDLTGTHNVFVGRKQKKLSDGADTWNKEVIESSNRLQRSKTISLKLSAKITADTVNFDYVSIEFNDRIKARKNNFYRAFCQEFPSRIDYFLKIYFVHRSETAKFTNFNAILSEVKSAIQAAAQQESKSILPIAPIDPQNSQILKTTLQVKPTEFTLTLVQGMLLSKDEKCTSGGDNSEKHSIRQLWAQDVIKMIPDILIGIFKLEVSNDVSRNPYRRIFDLTGLFDQSNRLFVRRQQYKGGAGTWINEIIDSSNRFNQTEKNVPLKLSAKIAADVGNFDSVSIEFSDQIRTKKRNFYRTFCQEFTRRIDYFLRIYFVYLNAMSKSTAVIANPAKSTAE